MVWISTSVDLDLSEVDAEEIFTEATDRIMSLVHRPRQLQKHESEIEDLIDELEPVKVMINYKNKAQRSLADEMRDEYLEELGKEFTEMQLREMADMYRRRKEVKDA